jgi:phosphatidylserine/phosphatidylglycerophosphate/cardiolipin synthase-like enzyme
MARVTALAVLCFVLALTVLTGQVREGREARARAEPGAVVINEVEYDTVQPGTDADWEWFELRNNTSSSFSLINWRIGDNNQQDIIPTLTLPPYGYAVVAATTAFRQNYPNFTGLVVFLNEPIGNGLSNGGDRLLLRNATGTVIDALSYGSDTFVFDCAGYPCHGVLPGHALEREPPGADTDSPVDFVARTPPSPGGDPPAATPTPTGAPGPRLLITGLVYWAYGTGELGEALRLMNVGATTADLTGVQITDGESTAIFPEASIASGTAIWLAKAATAFAHDFGFAPAFEYGSDTDPWVPNLLGGAPAFANAGDEAQVRDATGAPLDTLVYKAGSVATAGWLGPGLQPWRPTTSFAEEGQVLYRKLDETTGLPVPDTNTAADWAQDADDPIGGKRVQYPGWDLERLFATVQVTATGVLTVAVAPDNAYDVLLAQINAASTRLDVASLTLTNAGLVDALADKALQGIAVRVLLEGEPVGGVEDQERWACQQIESAGGECWFMFNDPAAGAHDRYTYQHAKFMLVDGERLIVSSENLTWESLPGDPKHDGTYGRRGALLITDAPEAVARAQTVFAADLDPVDHHDLIGWQPYYTTTYGLPPLGFTPVYTSGGTIYPVQQVAPLTLQGTFRLEVLQAPENGLQATTGLLALIAQAGAGDTILVEQLIEAKHWGAAASNPEADPNPRLQALVDAARRGARVRVLLDGLYDDPADPQDNAAARDYLNALARSEELDLEARLGNPTGLGIHNKMVLAQIGGLGTIHLGSLNGTELSSKGNRELALQVQSDAAYAYLKSIFDYDWGTATPPLYLPVVFHATRGAAQYVLVSEVVYDPLGPPDAEWIELYNPTDAIVDLSAYKLGDAQVRGISEGMAQFPPGAVLLPHGALVAAESATAFRQVHGFNPTYEFRDTDPAVPDMIPYTIWGAGQFALANGGDEVLLLDSGDQAVDVLVYGNGSYPGVVPHALIATGHSLERYPPWQDTDDCTVDFRARFPPGPGGLP